MIERDCDNCGRRYITKSEQSKFCAALECKRERARLRRRKADGKNVVPFTPPEADSPLVAAARAELGAVADTDAGRLVLILAARLDGSDKDTGSSFAALSREYRAARAEAMKNVQAEDDPIAKFRRANEERRLSVVR